MHPNATTAHRWLPFAATLTVAVAVLARLYLLDPLPGEIYNDILIVFAYVGAILDGDWPLRFVLSAGPLYHYLIAPLVLVGGQTYLVLKLASVAVSLVALAGTYLLGSTLVSRPFGLLAAFVAGVSSWLLIFSRLGNSQIVIPVLSTFALYFALRLARSGQRSDAALCATVAALGLFTYPQTFILPPVLLVVLGWLWLSGSAVRPAHLGLFALITAIAAIPFAVLVFLDLHNFFSGYIGGKANTPLDPAAVLLGNAARALLALHVSGDVVFRGNPAALPHLDPISGVLFLLGLVGWLRPRHLQFGVALLIPLLLLQLPSVLVLSSPGEVPSASRTIAIAPIAYLLVVSGLWWLIGLLRSVRALQVLILAASLATITYLNLDRYFRVYATGLPDGNTPFGRTIAEYLDPLPRDYTAYVVGCCWGTWQQPEPGGIAYALRVDRPIHLVPEQSIDCAWLERLPRPAVLVWSPDTPLPSDDLQPCQANLSPTLHRRPPAGPVFHSALLVETQP